MKTRRRRRRRITAKFVIILVLFIIALTLGILVLSNSGSDNDNVVPGETQKPGLIDSIFNKTPEPTETPEPEPTETPEPTPTPLPEFSPYAIEGTRPSDFGMETAIEVNGEIVSSYQREQTIDFGEGRDYTQLEGIITFRGNNFRDNPAYGTATIVEKTLDDANAWIVNTGSVPKVYGSGAWTGSGWTGQPLIVRWPEETKRIMNLYDSAKNKTDLVEVIYATMDGHIYFLDLDTGERTRDPINMGRYPFKGAGALDPRGYPLMYLGSGDDSKDDGEGSSHASIISLIDGKVLYEFGSKDSFSLRGKLS